MFTARPAERKTRALGPAAGEAERRREVGGSHDDVQPTANPSATMGAPMSDATSRSRIGKYYVLRKAGSGGFGTVYEGYDLDLERNVAIKVWTGADSELKRFEREARIWSTLNHPKIVRVFEYDRDPLTGSYYLVQEFLSGADLDKKIRDKDQLPPSLRVRYLRDIAEGLHFAHESGIVHRDLSPRNVRILHDHSIKIMDFGLARSAEETTLTLTRAGVGTRGYAALEQLEDGRTVDRRTDIFSFGILAYELLTWKNPFQSEHIGQYIAKLADATPTPITRLWPECPASLAAMIHQCLMRLPEDRYSSCRELLPILQENMELLRRQQPTPPEPTQRLSMDQLLPPTEAPHLNRSVVELLDDGHPTGPVHKPLFERPGPHEGPTAHMVVPPAESWPAPESLPVHQGPGAVREHRDAVAEREIVQKTPDPPENRPTRRPRPHPLLGVIAVAGLLVVVFLAVAYGTRLREGPPAATPDPAAATPEFAPSLRTAGTADRPLVELSTKIPESLDQLSFCRVRREPAWPSGPEIYDNCRTGWFSHIDSDVAAGSEYSYWVELFDATGSPIASSSTSSIVAGS